MCPLAICFSCSNRLLEKKFPVCKAIFTTKYPNNALLNLISESNYDKLKEATLKSIINLNEAREW
jgi:hypothetical protein